MKNNSYVNGNHVSYMYHPLENKFCTKIKNDPDLEGLVNFKQNEKLPIHSWYNFKEGYSASLVDKMLDELRVKSNSLVLDPFAGSGTTLLSAQWRGMTSIGIDIDPFFTFVQQVKLDWYKYDANDVKREIAGIEDVNEEEKSILKPPELSSFNGAKNNVFTAQTLQELLLFKETIENIKNKDTKRLFKLALASILEPVSLVKKDGKGLKFNRRKKIPKVKRVILKKVQDMLSDIKNLQVNPTVQKGDAKAFIGAHEGRRCHGKIEW